MGAAGIKMGVAAFLIALASQMSAAAEELVGRVRESVQASELLMVDGYVQVWAIEQQPTRGPRSQAEFERACREHLAARAGREPTADRWGQTYVYETLTQRGVHWRITSRGADRRLGTADDLVVERRGDVADINRDPVAIIERELERQKERDARALEALRALGDARRGGPREPGAADPAWAQLDALLGS